MVSLPSATVCSYVLAMVSHVLRFEGPHSGQFFDQIITQINKTARRLYPLYRVHVLKIKFMQIGNSIDPIDYIVTDIPESNFVTVNAIQKRRHVASGRILLEIGEIHKN